MILFLAPPPGTAISGGFLYNQKVVSSAPVDARKIDYRFALYREVDRWSEREVDAILLDSLLFSQLDLPAVRRMARRPLGLLYHHMPSMDPDLSSQQQLARTGSEMRKLRHCSLVIAPSRYVARTVRSRFAHRGWRPPTIAVVRPGVSSVHTNRSRAQEVLRKPNSRSGAEKPARILTVANLHPRKAQHRLLEALERLRRFSWRWDIVGSHEAAPDYARRFEDLVRRSPVAGRIAIHGPVSPEEVNHLYTEADLFALASRFETFGMVFTEAASHAVPSVAEAVGGIPEAVSHRESGLLCRPGTPIEKPLTALLASPQRRRQLGRSALRFAATLPDWETQAALFAEALRRLRPSCSAIRGAKY